MIRTGFTLSYHDWYKRRVIFLLRPNEHSTRTVTNLIDELVRSWRNDAMVKRRGNVAHAASDDEPKIARLRGKVCVAYHPHTRFRAFRFSKWKTGADIKNVIHMDKACISGARSDDCAFAALIHSLQYVRNPTLRAYAAQLRKRVESRSARRAWNLRVP